MTRGRRVEQSREYTNSWSVIGVEICGHHELRSLRHYMLKPGTSWTACRTGQDHSMTDMPDCEWSRFWKLLNSPSSGVKRLRTQARFDRMRRKPALFTYLHALQCDIVMLVGR